MKKLCIIFIACSICLMVTGCQNQTESKHIANTSSISEEIEPKYENIIFEADDYDGFTEYKRNQISFLYPDNWMCNWMGEFPLSDGVSTLILSPPDSYVKFDIFFSNNYEMTLRSFVDSQMNNLQKAIILLDQNVKYKNNDAIKIIYTSQEGSARTMCVYMSFNNQIIQFTFIVGMDEKFDEYLIYVEKIINSFSYDS